MTKAKDYNLIDNAEFLYKEGKVGTEGKFEKDPRNISALKEVSKELEKEGLIRISGKTFHLTKKGLAEAKRLMLKFKNVRRKEPTRLKNTKKINELKRFLNKVHEKFKINFRYDQTPMLPISAMEEAIHIKKNEDLRNKRVALIGDDDFLSLILFKTGKPKELLSLDIDDKLLGIIKEGSEGKIRTLKHDLRKPIPRGYKNKYDVIRTWPPDTILGVTLFISRGIELLKKNGVAYVSITCSAFHPANYGDFHPIELFQLLRKIDVMGLKLEEYTEKYGIYWFEGRKYYTDLMKLRITKKSKSLYGIWKGKIPF